VSHLEERTIVLGRQLGAMTTTRAPNRQQRANDILAVVLLAVLALAPIPLGSNRPFFWALWAAVLGAVGVGYMLVLVVGRERLRFSPARLWLPLVLTLSLMGFLALQMLPLSPAGFAFPTAQDELVAGRTLSLAPGSTWHVLLQAGTYVLFFLLMLQVAVNRTRARMLGAAILAIVAAHAAYGLVALTTLGDPLLFFAKWAYEGHATGTFVNRNSFATFLALGFVLGLALTLREALRGDPSGFLRPGKTMIYLAGTGLILAALFATGSRMGMFACFAGAAAVTLMAARKRQAERGRLPWLAAAALPMLAAIAVLVLYGAGTLERLGSLESDAGVRGELYAQVIGMIAARPWLGYGAGAFEVAYPLFHALPVSTDLVWDKAHSSYLTLFAELGLIAGSIPLVVMAILAVEAFGLYRRRQADWAIPAAAVGAGLVGGLHSLVDFSLEIEANMLLLLALLAIAIARPRDAGGASR
jgi:O-antigen ligase